MLKTFLGISALAAILCTTALPVSAAEFDCQSLRQACLMKDSLGEQGKGNCKRYRASGCAAQQGGFQGGGGGGVVIGGIGIGGGGGGGFGPGGGRCFKLQQACANKEQLGLQGLGICKQFRNECGG